MKFWCWKKVGKNKFKIKTKTMRSETSALGVKNNKIIITQTETIFLEFVKSFNIKNIKTDEDIILGEFSRENEDKEEENIVIIHWKNIIKTVEFIKNKYILIEKIVISSSAEILSNWELKTWDIIIPNTFISKNWETIFLDNTTIWKDYDMSNFGLMLSWIASEKSWEENEFEADIKTENIFTYLISLKSEELLQKTIVISQIEDENNFKNLVAVVDMMI